MHKNQQIKPKRSHKKQSQPLSHRQPKTIDKYHYETSHTEYNININYEQPKIEPTIKMNKPNIKSNKKIRFITEDIQKSQWVQLPKQLTNHKQLTLKVSSLNNIQDLNVHQKCKSSKKSNRGPSKEKRKEKKQLNCKNNPQNAGNIKVRAVKSHSKSVKKLTFKGVSRKSKEKVKSSKALRPVTTRQAKQQFHQDLQMRPDILQIQNSYYFSNHPQPSCSYTKSQTKGKSKSKETVRSSSKKRNMFLYESRDESWKKPNKTISNLQSTVDLLN